MPARASQQDVAMIRLREQLLHREAELFVEDEQNVGVRCFKHNILAAKEDVQSSSADLNISASTVTSFPALESFLVPRADKSRPNPDTEINRIQFYIISQKTSWSRLRITSKMFYKLCKSCTIPPELAISLLSHFGRKYNEDMRTNSICRASLSASCLEICYTIQHFQLHGRQLEDPWSCREIGICQITSLPTLRSSYVLIEGPSQFNQVIEKLLGDQVNRASRELEHHPLSVQVKLAIAATATWPSYLAYLEATVKDLHTIISFSEKTSNPKVNFELVHPLDLFQHKTMRARSILQSVTNVVQMLVAQSSKLSSRYGTTTNLEVELTHLISDLQDHIHTIDILSEKIQVTRALLIEICNHRLAAQQFHLLANLNATAVRQTELAAALSRGAIISRISALLTLIYLPLSLAASIFSSDLISVKHGDRALTEGAAVGWFLMVSLLLQGATAGFAWGWKWWEKHKSVAGLGTVSLIMREFGWRSDAGM